LTKISKRCNQPNQLPDKEKDIISDGLSNEAPLIDERCSYLYMLEFKILWELDYKDSPKLEKY
jgi:hypothetical protein